MNKPTKIPTSVYVYIDESRGTERGMVSQQVEFTTCFLPFFINTLYSFCISLWETGVTPCMQVMSIKLHNHFIPISGFIKILGRLKEELSHTRYFTYRFISVWKIVLFLICILVSIWMDGDEPAMFFQLFNEGLGPHSIVVEEVSTLLLKMTLLGPS